MESKNVHWFNRYRATDGNDRVKVDDPTLVSGEQADGAACARIDSIGHHDSQS